MPITFITPSVYADVVTASIAGEIDLATVAELHEHIDALLAEDKVTGIVLDLTAVTFLDSSGIGALIGCLRKANKVGKSLRVDNASGIVREVLELTNVMPLLTGATTPPAEQ